jgi:hypothetical protein
MPLSRLLGEESQACVSERALKLVACAACISGIGGISYARRRTYETHVTSREGLIQTAARRRSRISIRLTRSPLVVCRFQHM